MTDFWQRLAAAPFRHLLEFTSDPDGCPVYLSLQTWGHILEDHSDVDDYRQLLLAAISAPDKVESEDAGRNALYFFKRDPREEAKAISDPTVKCIMVIVKYVHPPEFRYARTGIVRTAWARRGMRRR